MAHLDFERPLLDLERRIRDLKAAAGHDTALDSEIARLESKAAQLQREIFSDLSAWQKVQLSRHPDRPYTLDYITRLFDDFVELHGDRVFGDDHAVVSGFARFRSRSVLVMGHQKGRGTKENMQRNFGMPHPEGYRKARRMVDLAERFQRPIVTFIDTPGAFPGLGAEERGQAEAIGQSILAMSRVTVPVVAVVIGEGGSGGALALGIANRVLMLEFATYAVITPEGCASILWKDGSRAPQAAAEMKMTASDLRRFGVVDGVIAEPMGGAHRDRDEAVRRVGEAIATALDALTGTPPAQLREERYRRFRAIGPYTGE